MRKLQTLSFLLMTISAIAYAKLSANEHHEIARGERVGGYHGGDRGFDYHDLNRDVNRDVNHDLNRDFNRAGNVYDRRNLYNRVDGVGDGYYYNDGTYIPGDGDSYYNVPSNSTTEFYNDLENAPAREPFSTDNLNYQQNLQGSQQRQERRLEQEMQYVERRVAPVYGPMEQYRGYD